MKACDSGKKNLPSTEHGENSSELAETKKLNLLSLEGRSCLQHFRVLNKAG